MTTETPKPIGQSEKVEINTKYENAMTQLKSNGFTLTEQLNIRNAITKWGAQFDDNIHHDTKSNYYSSKKIRNYAFVTEKEAKFANALVDFAPDANQEKLLVAMGIVAKLLDIESDYVFTSKK